MPFKTIVGTDAGGSFNRAQQTTQRGGNMKSRKATCTAAITLFAALAMPVWTAAQDSPSQEHKPKHHQYKLIDIGTLGGPASYYSEGGAGNLVLNSKGTVAGYGDTTAQDPYYPNCFDPDCYLAYAFRWENGVLTNLGSLPGLNNSAMSGINEHGWVVGTSENGVFDPILNVPASHGVLWKDGQTIDLGTFGGYQSNAIYVNNEGQVVGFASNTILDPYSFLGAQTHTFLWQNGVLQDLGTLGGPDSFPSAGGINQRRGLVAGGSYINDIPNPTTGMPTQDPFLWRDGHMRDLGTLGGTNGFAVVVNNLAQVAGDSNLAGDLKSHPFLWDKGVLTDLGTLGRDNGLVNWINDDGEVVGRADLPGGSPEDAFLWRKGVMTDLGNLGGVRSNAFAINSEHQIVGSSLTPAGRSAFLWENGGPMIDLNALIPANSSLSLVYGYNINDRGEIAGVGVPAGCAPFNVDFCGHVFLLIPCDEKHRGQCEDYSLIEVPDNASATQPTAVIEQIVDSPSEIVHQLRNVLKQRYHVPGQPIAPRD
jgi:probable HAF family extracellular repeat protein